MFISSKLPSREQKRSFLRLASFARLSAFLLLALLLPSKMNASPPLSPKNSQLLSALEPLEGLTEAALGGSDAKIEHSLKEAESNRGGLRDLLGNSASAYDTHFTDVYAARQRHDSVGIALAAAELYKVVALALEPATLTIPREVSLLDYVGFRTKALLKAPVTDWSAVVATSHEANGYWAAIRERVKDSKLQSAMDRAQRDMLASAQAHNTAGSTAATRADLDLVDELETYFSR